jgi:small subunit ribosomal protein S9
MAEKYIYKIGRRKNAIATVRLFTGKGTNQIDGKDADKVFANAVEQVKIFAPFKVLDLDPKDYYFSAKLTGGGHNGQLEALVLAISRALSTLDATYIKRLRGYGLLTRDPRMVERKKTGLRKARKSEQYSKR